jgi:hypothetical protein
MPTILLTTVSTTVPTPHPAQTVFPTPRPIFFQDPTPSPFTTNHNSNTTINYYHHESGIHQETRTSVSNYPLSSFINMTWLSMFLHYLTPLFV